MLDTKFIRENPDIVRKSMTGRGDDVELVGKFLQLDEKRRGLLQAAEDIKRRKNEASRKIGELIKQKADVTGAKAEVNSMSDKIKELDDQLNAVETEYYTILDLIPNISHESVPVGKGEADNKLIKEAGEVPEFSFEARDHLELGQINKLFDFERGAKITGSFFPLYVGLGARLERALINFMLDVHVKEHGYREVFPPFLVNRKSMYGTGQIPKLEEDMYRIAEEDYFLIPTAEVPVTNLHADEVLDEEELPVCYTAYTACFRREAGSYGKDTKGLIRVHQFDKVELVRFTRPEDSMGELEKLLADAEDILKKLELPYRVSALCTAEISFSAHKCYDIELWAPGTKKWLEVSSCSVFTDFQARRANIKYQPAARSRKPRYVHTLNGSGVALPRLVIALLEIHQNEDGSVNIPEPLRPYFGAERIEPGVS
ncbi:MAG: serine--tRNA ligase [Candidatus Omnitrophota bacterium]|nr:serine--tRNA ligase [Candidatus Omnitrophota bacterium]